MRRILAVGAFVVVVAASPSAGMAFDPAHDLAVAVVSAQILQQRKDVDEVSRPQPPNGPATPVPFCSPGQPICP